MHTKIDGEDVRIGMLYSRFWTHKLVKNLLKAEFNGNGSMVYDTLLAIKSNTTLGHRGMAKETGKPADRRPVSCAQQSPEIGFRPVLQFVDGKKLAKDNPDGSISVGGTLYVDGIVVDPQKPYAYPFFTVSMHMSQDPPPITIRDTEPGYELTWMWHSGFLVCTTTPVLNLSVNLATMIGLNETIGKTK